MSLSCHYAASSTAAKLAASAASLLSREAWVLRGLHIQHILYIILLGLVAGKGEALVRMEVRWASTLAKFTFLLSSRKAKRGEKNQHEAGGFKAALASLSNAWTERVWTEWTGCTWDMR